MGCLQSKTVEGESEITKDVLYERTATVLDQPRGNLAERVKKGRQTEKRPKFDPKITKKYVIQGQIGKSGKYTKVFRVENKFTKQPSALKLLIKPEGLAAMECEKAILSRLKHRNIVRLVEVLMSDKQRILALVLELLTGGNLFDRIHVRGMFSERSAAKVLAQVLDGIQYLHSIGITHRGLTLHNILFYHQGKDSRVVLSDFATAHMRKSAEDTVMREPCGSREYFAPEVVMGRPYTQSVDLWAVGVVTYAMLTAEFPFPSLDKQAMLLAIAKAEYSMESEVWQSRSESCREFVSSLLCLDPDGRLTASKALQHAWLTSRRTKEVPLVRNNRSSSVDSTASSVHSLHHLRPAQPARSSTSSRLATSLRHPTPQLDIHTPYSSTTNWYQPTPIQGNPSVAFATFDSPLRHAPTGQSRYKVADTAVSFNDYGRETTLTRKKSNRRRRNQAQLMHSM